MLGTTPLCFDLDSPDRRVESSLVPGVSLIYSLPFSLKGKGREALGRRFAAEHYSLNNSDSAFILNYTNGVFFLTRLRLMFDVVNLPMDWPVEVNYHEAKAFCSWRGPDFRLPTEAEHHVMRGPQV